jgi:hypothetical protein
MARTRDRSFKLIEDINRSHSLNAKNTLLQLIKYALDSPVLKECYPTVRLLASKSAELPGNFLLIEAAVSLALTLLPTDK